MKNRYVLYRYENHLTVENNISHQLAEASVDEDAYSRNNSARTTVGAIYLVYFTMVHLTRGSFWQNGKNIKLHLRTPGGTGINY